MGAKGRSRRAEVRRKEKAKRKAAQRALYQSYRDNGQNGKRRKLRNRREKSVQRVRHAVAFCGNVGCEKCFPQLARLRMDGTGPRGLAPLRRL